MHKSREQLEEEARQIVKNIEEGNEDMPSILDTIESGHINAFVSMITDCREDASDWENQYNGIENERDDLESRVTELESDLEDLEQELENVSSEKKTREEDNSE